MMVLGGLSCQRGSLPSSPRAPEPTGLGMTVHHQPLKQALPVISFSPSPPPHLPHAHAAAPVSPSAPHPPPQHYLTHVGQSYKCSHHHHPHQHPPPLLPTWGSGPLLCMAGYSSQCELFFIMSKFYFDRVDPLEPNLLVLDNIDIE